MIGAHSRHCIYGNICAQLYCYQSNLKCVTNGMPAAQENFENFFNSNILYKLLRKKLTNLKGTTCRLNKGMRGGISGVRNFIFVGTSILFSLVYFWTELIKILRFGHT